MQVTFKPFVQQFSSLPEGGVLVVPLFEDASRDSLWEKLGKEAREHIERALTVSKFKGRKGQILSLIAPGATSFDRIIFCGLGAATEASERTLVEAGGSFSVEITKASCSQTLFFLDGLRTPSLKNSEVAAYLASGVLLRSYRFYKYKTKMKEEDHHKIEALMVFTESPEEADHLFEHLSHQAEGVFLTRGLMIEPANVVTTSTFIQEINALKKLGVVVEVLDEDAMTKLGMNALLAVGQGSSSPSYLAIMHWQGGKEDEAPLAFVGKGVIFDTGGISIKPSAKMDEMKMDMGGAAVVTGLMHCLARRKASVNAIGVVGLVENMPDGAAIRPGDIVKSLSGQTIEILNTDAEGRLVLADALWYTQDRFHPQLMVDVATLTGAVVVALGTKYAAVMGTDQEAIDRLRQVGDQVGEHVWQLPLDDRYDKDINSPLADVKNTGAHGAGTITAGHFLKRFINKAPWVHIDIAGVAWSSETHPLSGSYPSGFGVRLLDNFIARYYEKSL